MNTTAAAERHLILLRGLPGAGKSSLAKVLAENKWPVYAIDDFFTHPVTGVYSFRYEDNHLAYKACETNTEKALEKSIEKVFIDNTFTLAWELEPYFKLAKKYGYRLHVVTVENHHGSANSHGVSKEQGKKMAAKYAVKLY
jgi:predicted kinase